MVVPREVVYEKFRVPHIVKSYSRIPDVIELPPLVQIQVDSYEVFIKESLRELLDEISPIQDFTGNRLEMRFTEYRFGEPKYNQDECRERDATFAAPLRVNVQLLVKETGEIKEQEIFMGDFPLMTEKGTFIINGAERVVVSQLVRSPGVYLTLERDATSGRDLCYAKLIPNRGAWLEFETSNRDVVSVKVDRKRKIPVTTLLRAIDEPELLPKHPSAQDQGDPGEDRKRQDGARGGQAAPPAAPAARHERPHPRAVRGHRQQRGPPVHQGDAGPRPHFLEQGRGAARVLPAPAPGRPAHDRQREGADQLAVLQPAPLRPRQGRPLQGQQAPWPRRRHPGARADPRRPDRHRPRDRPSEQRRRHARTTSTTWETAACGRWAS